MNTDTMKILGFGMPGMGEWVIIGIFFMIFIVPIIIVVILITSKKEIDKTKLFNTYKFASFGQRLLARFIDVIITGTTATLLAVIIDSGSPRTMETAPVLGMFLFCFIYQPILDASGGTWGKKIIGIRTINLETGKALSFIKSYGRSFLYFLFFTFLVIPALLSGLAVLWTMCKQTWHDLAFNVVVISNDSSNEIKAQWDKQNSILKHADKLRELKLLQDQGIISNEEFETEKRKIVDSDN